MKKIKLLSLLMLPFLVACNSGATTSLWSETNIEIMEEHLSGNVLPYIELEGLTVTYNRSNTSVDLYAPSVTKATFDSYKSKLTGDGYTEVITDCLKDQYTSKGFHTYTKIVNTGVLYVDLYCLNANSQIAIGGSFNANAYFYEIVAGENEPIVWTVVEKRIMSTYLEGNILPYCGIANNSVTYDSVGENVRIYAPHADQDDVRGYLSTLTSNGYVEVTTGYEDVGFHEVNLTLSANKTLVVQVYTYSNGVNLGLEGEFYADAFIRVN